MKVDFVLSGTQKGGTSALDSYLREHPRICMADQKEVHFFDNETLFAPGTPNDSHYHSAFSPSKEQTILGEATPIYMYWKSAPQRMSAYNPKMKLIVVLRNPIDRAYSHWNMERLRNAENLPFHDALLQEKDRCCEAAPFQHRVFSYIDRGFYMEQLRRIWKYFPREQVLVLRNEDLRFRPDETLQKVCAFLDIETCWSQEVKDVHSLSYLAVMDDRDFEHLSAVFLEGIREIEQEFGWDCSAWLKR